MDGSDLLNNMKMAKSLLETAYKVYDGWSEDKGTDLDTIESNDILYSKGDKVVHNYIIANSDCTLKQI